MSLVLLFAYVFDIWHVHGRRGDVRSPPPLLLSLLRWCWCGAGVVLVWCACGGFDGGAAAAVAFV